MTKRHETLGITFAELGALLGTRELLKADMLEHDPRHVTKPGTHEFDMNTACKPNGECGTVSCIGGTMALIMGKNIGEADLYVRDTSTEVVGGKSPALGKLFYPGRDGYSGDWSAITPAQAIAAIDNFLAGGHPRWMEVLDDNEQ